MPRNKKPRKKFTCRKIERIDVIIDTMTNVGFSVELKLPNGTFDRDDMRALADFSNLTGVTFSELGEDRLSEEDLISSNELQCALSDSLTYLRTYKNKAKFYVPTGEELKTIQEAVTFFLPVMEEIVKDSPKLIIKFWNKTKNLMTRPDGAYNGVKVSSYE